MKKITLFLGLMGLSIALTAQISSAQELQLISYDKQMNNVLQHVNTSSIHGKILLDKGYQLAPIESFDGSANSLASDLYTWKLTYLSLYSAQTALTMSDPDLTVKQFSGTVSEGANLSFGIIYYKAQRFKKDALSTGAVSESGNQLYTVYGRDPFEDLTVFSVSPLAEEVLGSRVKIKIGESAKTFSNLSPQFDHFDIDWDENGNVATVLPGQSVEINWRDPGTKTIHVIAYLSNGSIFHSYSRLKVSFSSSIYPAIADIVQPFPLNHNHSGGQLMIAYGCGHSNIKRPLLIVEGFEVAQAFGDGLDYSTFVRKLRTEVNSTRLSEHLDLDQYDLIYLNYNDGTDLIERNAELLKEAIDWINREKALNGSTEPNTIIAESMGGLVTTVALRQMEIAGIDHEVDDFISLDVPYKGAHVPPGLQSFFHHMYSLTATVSIKGFDEFFRLRHYVPQLSQGMQILNAPAARQMLKYKIEGEDLDPSLFGQFQQYLNSLGMPQQTAHNICLTNGSLDGVLQDGFSAGSDLIDLHLKKEDALQLLPLNQNILSVATSILGIFGKLDLTVKALPIRSPQDFEIYHGKIVATIFYIPVVWSNRSVTVRDLDPIDNAPGGYNSINMALGDIQGIPNVVKQAIKFDRFCFVPLTSSMALACSTPGQIVRNQASGTFYKSDGPIYQNVINEENNEFHTDITEGGSRFIYKTLIGDINDLRSNPNSVTGSYNIGENLQHVVNKRITNSVTVRNGGKLGINAALGLGSSSQNGYPATNSDCYVQVTAGCGANNPVIEIENGGQLILGDGPLSCTSTLNFAYGTSLRLRNGSRLILNNSKLNINSGASVLLEPGCSIELIGNNAEFNINGILMSTSLQGAINVLGQGILKCQTFELKTGQNLKVNGQAAVKVNDLLYAAGSTLSLNGPETVLELNNKLYLLAGSQFNITSDQGVQNGFLRINSVDPEFISASPGAAFSLSGKDKSDKILEVNCSGLSLSKLSGLSNFRLNSGKIVFLKDHEQTNLSIDIPCLISRVSFSAGSLPFIQKGLVINSRTGVVINACEFDRVNLNANRTSDKSALRISDSEFNTGILTVNSGGVNLSGLLFKNRAFAQLNNLDNVPSYITHLKSDHNDAFLGVVRLENSIQNVSCSNWILANNNKGLFINAPLALKAATINLSCSEFSGSEINNIELSDSKLNAGPYPVAGKNSLLNAGLENINCYHSNLELNNGNNLIVSSTDIPVIRGFVTASAGSVCDYKNAKFSASGNQWYEGSVMSPNGDSRFSLQIDCPNGETYFATITDNSPKKYIKCSSPTTIPAGSIPQLISGLGICPTCPVLASGELSGYQLVDALFVAHGNLSDQSLAGDDERALKLSRQILSKPFINGNSESAKPYLEMAFDMAKNAWGNIILKSGKVPSKSVTDDYMSALNSLNEKVSRENLDKAWKIEMSKYEFFRNQNDFTQAIKVLDNMLCGLPAKQAQAAIYYKQLLKLESQSMNGAITNSIWTELADKLYTEYTSSIPSTEITSANYFKPSIVNGAHSVTTYQCFTKSKQELTVQDPEPAFSEIRIYPNPATSVINIENDGTVDQINISDISGKIVLTKHTENSSIISINIDELVVGLYIVNNYDQKGLLLKSERVTVLR